ncbi:hypothetical protein D3C76_587440 [compost metagenome]
MIIAERIGAFVEDAALGIDVAADTPFVQLARQGVGGAELEQVFGQVGVELGALFGFVGVLAVLGLRVGVASAHLPVRGQCPHQLQVDTLGTHLAGGFVAGEVGTTGLVGSFRRAIFLINLEDGHAGIERAVEVLTLDTDFVVLAFDRADDRGIPGQFRLGHEDIGVACVDRVMVIEVVDHAGVTGDVTGYLVVGIGVVAVIDLAVHRLVVIPVQTRANDQLERVGQVDPGGGIDPFLLDVLAEGVDVGHRRFAHTTWVDAEQIVDRQEHGTAVGAGLDFTLAGTDHQLMLALEQLERATRVHIVGGLVIVTPLVEHPLAENFCSRRAGALEHRPLHGKVGPALGSGQVQAPVVAKAVVELGESRGVVDVLIAPVVTNVGGAGVTDMAAITVDRQATPVDVVIVVLVGSTQGQGGAVGQVELGDAIEQATLATGVVLVAVLVVVGAHEAPAHAGAGIERATEVQLAAVVVPTARGTCDAALELLGGPFAHHVDRRRRIACALHQARGTAHDFDPVIRGHVGCGDPVGVVGGRQAVEHQVGDGKATREILAVGWACCRHPQAGGGLHHVIEAAHGLVVHPLAGDDRYRLRRFAYGQRQLGGALHGAGGV